MKNDRIVYRQIKIKAFKYALQEPFRRKGYMREGVAALIEWILKNEDVKFIVADTLKRNIASHGLL